MTEETEAGKSVRQTKVDSMMDLLMDGKVGAVPHDLLKVVASRRRGQLHTSHKLVEMFLESVRGKYVVACGYGENHTVEEIIEKHHAWGKLSMHKPWELLWKFSDSHSVVAGRFRLEYDYWYASDGDPFFVGVYGDFNGWSREKRSELWRKVSEILVEYCNNAEEQFKAFMNINDLLKSFPADSRFPFVGLKTHHWLTDAIRLNEVFQDRIKNRKYSLRKMYLVRVSLAEPEVEHRLKELRSFRDWRFKNMQVVVGCLLKWFPLLIGDDVYLVCLEGEVKEVCNILSRTGLGFYVDVFEWVISRLKKKVVPNSDSPVPVLLVIKCDLKQLSVGVHDEYEFAPESYAEWARVLDEEYDYVAWICIMPKGDMKEIAEEFLVWGEKELSERRKNRTALKEPVRECEEFLSPELALSIAEGYNDFLEDCARVVNEENPEANTVCKSFSKAIFIRGLNEPSEGYFLYDEILDKKAKLHMPAVLSVVVAKPKYPFWRVNEIFEKARKHGLDSLVFVVGEKMVELTYKHADLVNKVIPFVRRTRKRAFYKIVNAACKDDKEILKVKIRALANAKKLGQNGIDKQLCWVVDEIAKQCGQNEKLRKQVTCEVFKILRMFTASER
ncbi:MAG: hypothetical protein QXU21_07680 [Candidatus Bathyarchaeia archaeon]